MRFLFVLSSVLIIGIVISSSVSLEANDAGSAPNSKLLVRMQPGYIIQSYNLQSGETKALWQSEKYRVRSVSVSPNNKYIALIEETKPEYSTDNYTVPPMINLLIIDGSGNYVNRIDMDVSSYVWSPDGEKIAFVTFRPCDADYHYKCPTGAWIFDIGSSEVTKLADKAWGIRWAAFNQAVYYFYRRDSVLQWDANTRISHLTQLCDIDISPDGKYYLPTPAYESEFIPVLYRTHDNKEVVGALPKDIGALVGWAFSKGHYLHYQKAEEKVDEVTSDRFRLVKSREVLSQTSTIYDPETQTVVKVFDGKLGHWIGDGSQIIVERDGKVVLEELP